MYRLDSVSRIKDWQNSDQIIKQIKLNRRLKGVDGSMFFCSKNFIENRLGINEALQNGVYQQPALNLENKKFEKFTLPAPCLEENGNKLRWNFVDGAFCYVVYKFIGRNDKKPVVFGITTSNEIDIPMSVNEVSFAVVAVNRAKKEGCLSNRVVVD